MRCAIYVREAMETPARLQNNMLQILQDCKKTCGVSWSSKPQEMAGYSRENYGGRFAGILWLGQYVVYLGILIFILLILGKKNIGRTRSSKPQEMAGYLRENYGGRFAGILWLGRLEVNPNTAVNDAEQ